MSPDAPFIIYLHGFNSSPLSIKATRMKAFLEGRGLSGHYACPGLPNHGGEAMRVIEAEMALRGKRRFCCVGSSLGGYYATWLAERHDARAVLVNPAITPHLGLRDHLGLQHNLHTGKPYQLTEEHLLEWEHLWVPQISPSRYFLLVETGDELLDYREAVARYAGARQLVIEGGDHSLQSFEQHLPAILAFAGLNTPSGSS